MESLGQKFKTTRETRGFTIDQVARDTHIAKRFIASLEEENFEPFPGDTYVLGFIRNYADYLGLDPEELAALYKNFKLQEQPIPIQELLQRKSHKKLIFVIIGIFLIAGLGAGGYFFSINLPRSEVRAERREKSAAGKPEPVQYTFADEILEQSFGQGDEVIVKRGDISYAIKIDKIENTVFVIAPVENLNLQEGEEAYIRLSPQGETLKVSCREIKRESEPPKAVLVFDKYLQAPAGDDAGILAAPAENQAAPASVPSPVIGSTNEPSRIKRSQVILESPAQASFTLEVEFRGYCLFRYITDNQNREERYFRRGETFRADVRGEIRLWYSNSASLRARISGNEIEFGKPGEVGAAVIRWVQAETGRGYRLELIPMY